MTIEIKHRYTGAIIHTVDADDLSGADLSGADLCGADLSGANLRGAIGISEHIIVGGIRADGYQFIFTRDGYIQAGCRNFTVSEAQKHWNSARPEGDPLGDETRLIIAHMLSVAKLRGW